MRYVACVVPVWVLWGDHLCVVVSTVLNRMHLHAHCFGIYVWVGVLLLREAIQLLDKLMHFNGRVNLVTELPELSSFDHTSWQACVNAASGPMRVLRVLMPLGMMIDIMEHANMSLFTNAGGAVECEV